MKTSTVGIIGAGTMGAGIAQVAATGGWSVQLLELDTALAHRAVEGIARHLERAVEKGRMSQSACRAARNRLRVADSPTALKACELIIEAIIEDLDAKVRLFSSLAPVVGADCILATNTSSLSVGKIGAAVGQARRLAGMHFFNPAPLMPLVEIVSTAETAPAVANRLAEVARSWGKTVVRCTDTPGFIVNRVARGYYLESLRILGEGAAGLAEIDDIMRRLGGFRMGPFELMDLVGIDVNYTVSCSVYEQLGRPPRLEPHPIQAELFRNKRLGKKTGAGFYDYSRGQPKPVIEVAHVAPNLPEDLQAACCDFASRATAASAGAIDACIFSRVLVSIINEASLALHEGVASAPDIDTAMKTGTNYPRGPLEWATTIGPEVCSKLLDELERNVGNGRYTPAPHIGA